MAATPARISPDALRGPAGPLPADSADDVNPPPEQAEPKAEAEWRLAEWAETGSGIASSSLYDGISFFSTGLGNGYTHDGQIGFIPCGYDENVIGTQVKIDLDMAMADASKKAGARCGACDVPGQQLRSAQRRRDQYHQR